MTWMSSCVGTFLVYLYSYLVTFSSFLFTFWLCLLNSCCRSPNTNTQTHNQHQPIHPPTLLLANLVHSNPKRCTGLPLEDLAQKWSETKQENQKTRDPGILGCNFFLSKQKGLVWAGLAKTKNPVGCPVRQTTIEIVYMYTHLLMNLVWRICIAFHTSNLSGAHQTELWSCSPVKIVLQ